MKTLNLTRNLRKSILQGAPWIYKESIENLHTVKAPELCKVKDQKGKFLCWAYADPYSPLGIRVLSTDPKPPSKTYFEGLFTQAFSQRAHLDRSQTNCFRLFNGEGDLLPGLVCDIYNNTAVLQFDGKGPLEFWDQEWIAEWLLNNTFCTSAYHKPRHDFKSHAKWWGAKPDEDLLLTKENSVLFKVDVLNGQKTGFFLDQRDNRNYIKSIAKDKSVLNLFSYSGGFSIYAGVGGARTVTSVDIAAQALELAKENWSINNLPDNGHDTKAADVFEYVKDVEEKHDIVICDPPSLAKSKNQKEPAIQKYIETFAASAKKVNKNGHLVLSSCSSHINFEDFSKIATESLSKAKKRGQVLRVSGQGEDHPYPQACPQMRYLKFMDIRLY